MENAERLDGHQEQPQGAHNGASGRQIELIGRAGVVANMAVGGWVARDASRSPSFPSNCRVRSRNSSNSRFRD
jgi:hypothetical protein